jgi:hypothetical protein
LTFGKEKLGKCICIHLGKDRASKVAPNSADADGAEFVRVVGILVKGKEVTEGQVLSELRWDIIVQDQGKELGEGRETVGVRPRRKRLACYFFMNSES